MGRETSNEGRPTTAHVFSQKFKKFVQEFKDLKLFFKLHSWQRTILQGYTTGVV